MAVAAFVIALTALLLALVNTSAIGNLVRHLRENT